MKRKQAKQIINTYYDHLNIHINNIAVHFDLESIHQFRVEYKMMRAFLRMITKQYQIPGELTISKKLKTSYHISGTIRDLQLQNKRIIKVSSKTRIKNLEYRRLLQKEIINLKPKLINIFLSNPVSKSRKKTAETIPRHFSDKNLFKFIRQKWARIYKIIQSENLGDVDIHTIRKHLKDLFYNMVLVAGCKDTILSACIWEGKDEQYLNNLLDLLGKYQDKCTAIALLKPGWLNSLTGLEFEFLFELNKIWLGEKKQMKKGLVSQLKSDLTSSQIQI